METEPIPYRLPLIQVLMQEPGSGQIPFAGLQSHYIPDDMKDRLTMGEDIQRVLRKESLWKRRWIMMEEKCETYPSKFITYDG